MPHVSDLITVTRDGQYVLAAGTYKPRLRVYDTSQMSMKYEKVMESSVVQLVCLEDDYSKVRIVFQQALPYSILPDTVPLVL